MEYSTGILAIHILFYLLTTVRASDFAANADSPFLSNLFHAYQQVCDPLKTNMTRQISPQSYIFCLPLITGIVTENNAWMSELYKGSLAMEPPPTVPNSRTSVYFSSAVVEQFSISEAGGSISDVEVVVSLSWVDSRLKWDTKEWPFRIFPVKLSVHHQLWGPLFTSAAVRNVQSIAKVTYNDASLHSNGTVFTSVSIKIPTARCTNDLHRYPYDRQQCCFEFRIEPWNVLRTIVSPSNALMDSNWDSPSPWTLENVQLTLIKPSGHDVQQKGHLRLCMTALRNSATVSAELNLPMAVSAVVFVCAQLTGKWKTQVYIKLAALFIQLTAFQSLVLNTNLSVASRLPTVYCSYNFTVVMTVISLLQTLILWSLYRRMVDTPPPYRMVLLGEMVGRYLYGQKRNNHGKDPGTQVVLMDSANAINGWQDLIYTLHVVLSLLMTAVYLFGICLIYL